MVPRVLAEQAPDLHAVLDRTEAEGITHLILDGKIVDTDRLHLKTISKKGKEIDSRIGSIAKAALVLVYFEHSMIT